MNRYERYLKDLPQNNKEPVPGMRMTLSDLPNNVRFIFDVDYHPHCDKNVFYVIGRNDKGRCSLSRGGIGNFDEHVVVVS